MTRIKKVACASTALLVLIGLALWIAFSVSMNAYRKELMEGSQIASTSHGEIEYALAGEGIPILRIHGRPGGYDQTIAGPRARPEDYVGLQTIALSRPGYLRTPLSSGRTPAEQADLYAALLNQLNIKRAIIYGVSAGGPSALQFAIRHPDKTLGLVLVVPYLEGSSNSERSNPGKVGTFFRELFFWTGGQVFGETFAPMFMHDLKRDDAVAMAQLKIVSTAFLVSDLRSAGSDNDVLQFDALDIRTWPLESVTTPTLIVHGNADTNAPYAGSVQAARRIPNAKLITIEGGAHTIVVSHAAEIRDHIRAFVRQVKTPSDEN